MKINVNLEYDNKKYMIVEVSELTSHYLDLAFGTIFEEYKNWFFDNYKIHIKSPLYPIKGYIIKFMVEKNKLTDDILIAFKLRFA